MIGKWLKKIKEKEDKEEYYKGFGWAMSTYFLDKAPLCDIRFCIYNDDEDHFDKGAMAAVDVIEANCQRDESVE